MPPTVDDVAAEAVAWAAVLDATLGSVLRHDLCAAEATGRAAVVADSAAGLFVLGAAMAVAAASAAHRDAEGVGFAAGLAASEAAVVAVGAPPIGHPGPESPADLRAAVEDMRQQRGAVERDIERLEAARADAADAAARDRTVLRGEVEALEMAVVRQREQLHHVGVDVAAAKQRLAAAEAGAAEAEAEAAQSAERRRDAAAAAAAAQAQAQAQAQAESDREGGGPAGAAAPPAQGHPTLQSVRAQLSEIRSGGGGGGSGAYQSGGLGSSYGGFAVGGGGDLKGSGGVEAAAVTPAAVRSMRAPEPRRTTMDIMSANCGSGAVTMSPWKARLQKLQSDLKTLRTELGSPEGTAVAAQLSQ